LLPRSTPQSNQFGLTFVVEGDSAIGAGVDSLAVGAGVDSALSAEGSIGVDATVTIDAGSVVSVIVP
jgi:hypothetical protein